MDKPSQAQSDFKKINRSNWQIIDEPTALWMQMTVAAKKTAEWVDYYRGPQLNPGVPTEIVMMLEVACGAMIYGWFFCPLLTLGSEQCWRVLESGVRLRCKQLGIKTKRQMEDGQERDTYFAENVKSLVKSKVIRRRQRTRWNAVRKLRNSASHPSRQTLLDPGQAQGILESTVESLNDLFPRQVGCKRAGGTSA